MRKYSSSTVKEVATEQHCAFAFDTLRCQLKGLDLPEPTFDDVYTALFVTWNIRYGNGWRLRGCIGTLEPRMLHVALRDYTLTSALRDSRFNPVQLKELPQLQCKVSLLSCFEDAADWQDWTVGVHGLIIEFTDPDMQCRRSATYLPDVALEQGWDKKEAVDSLIRKAGFDGRVGSHLRSSLRVVRYQSTIASLSYDQWMDQWQNKAEAQGGAAVGVMVGAGRGRA